GTLDRFVGRLSAEDEGPPLHSPRLPAEVQEAQPDLRAAMGYGTHQLEVKAEGGGPPDFQAASSSETPPRAKKHVEKDPHDCSGVALCKSQVV
ncbi:unnamed protein product, partial [Symbiodinium sp. CCMP2456]